MGSLGYVIDWLSEWNTGGGETFSSIAVSPSEKILRMEVVVSLAILRSDHHCSQKVNVTSCYLLLLVSSSQEVETWKVSPVFTTGHAIKWWWRLLPSSITGFIVIENGGTVMIVIFDISHHWSHNHRKCREDGGGESGSPPSLVLSSQEVEGWSWVSSLFMLVSGNKRIKMTGLIWISSTVFILICCCLEILRKCKGFENIRFWCGLREVFAWACSTAYAAEN